MKKVVPVIFIVLSCCWLAFVVAITDWEFTREFLTELSKVDVWDENAVSYFLIMGFIPFYGPLLLAIPGFIWLIVGIVLLIWSNKRTNKQAVMYKPYEITQAQLINHARNLNEMIVSPTQIKVCRQCGNVMKDSAKYCNTCGSSTI